MANSRWLLGATVLGAAVLYQQVLRNMISIAGVGRVMEPVAHFPYSCKRVYHEKLESCEDLWLDNQNRQLYLACSGMKARTATRYDTGELNASALPSGAGWISVLSIDEPGTDGLYNLRSLSKGSFKGYRGDGTLNTNGFDVQQVDDETLRFFITDLEPLLDPVTKKPIAEISVNKRTAIQVFRHQRGSDHMQFEYELAGEGITLPNRAAVLKDGNVVVTNDHSHAGGMLEMLIGGGSLAFCNTGEKRCHVAVDKGLAFPNGLKAGPDGLLYVPNCYSGNIQTYKVEADKSITLVDSFNLPYALDNFAFDAKGDLWAPAISKMTGFKETMAQPHIKSWHTTVWRFNRQEGSSSWTATKVLEDVDREIVAGATSVEHDTKTGRLFMSGAYTPYMIVCEPQQQNAS